MEDIKSATSQYQSALNDDDLVDMNEIIQCNIDNWNDVNNAQTQLSQEIKLESYNFLGSKINYEDEQFELDAYRLPDNYFKPENLHTDYESEDEIVANGDSEVINIADRSDEVINIADDSDDDGVGVVNLLNSIRSDHNYSSQEMFASDETNVRQPEAVVPESAEASGTIDHVNEMQALIANWLTHATSDNKQIILNDLEKEIKRIKSTVLDVSEEVADPVGPDVDASDDTENDFMSEGHSEPLEYRANQVDLTTAVHVSEHIDEETQKTLKRLCSVTEQISSKVANFSKLFASDSFSGETVQTELTDITHSGHELVKSVQAMCEVLKIEVNVCVGGSAVENVVNATLTNESGGDAIIGLSADKEIGEIIDKSVEEIVNENIDKLANGDVENNAVADSVANENPDGKVDDQVKETVADTVTETVADTVTETVTDKVVEDATVDEVAENLEDATEDKASKLNDKSKKRWLASSSSEKESTSDESSSSHTPTVRRRKKRPRSSTTTSDDEPMKNRRTKNVLLDSSDDDRSEDNVSASTELEMVRDSEIGGVLNDIDMSKYLIPSEADMPVQDGVYENVDDTNEQRADSEVEEFLGFDGPTCDDIPSPSLSTFSQEVVEQITEKVVTTETSTEVAAVTEEDQPIETVKRYVESEQWDLPEDPIFHSDKENEELLDDILSPQRVIENGTGNEDQAVEDGEVKDNEAKDNEAKDNEAKENEAKENEAKDNEEMDNEENVDDESADSEYNTDEEINRLIDLSTIPTKSRPVANHAPVYKKRTASKPKPKDDILDLIKDSASQDKSESESSSEEDIISEEQYLLQLAKQKCLTNSSDDSDDDADSVDSVDTEGRSSIDDITDESNDSKLDRFLKKRLVNEIENDLQSEEKVDEAATKEHPVVDDYADDARSEPESELQSSGIFEPEIELHDGEKLSVHDNHDSDAGETTEQSKPPAEKKTWKLDKIAFNKNLFKDLDDPDEKNSNAINSDDSDCEMLDISMFKTKKSAGDLDKIIQNQKKRNVSKTSSKLADECISLSSDSDLEIDKAAIDDDSEDDKPTKSRPMLRNDQLAGETKQAQKEENERLKRLDKKSQRLTQIVESQSERLLLDFDGSDVILDYDTKKKCAISVHPEIVKNLKEHQIAGVKFMYDCCYGSVDSIDKHPGSGCILAHCMGLGKTLQLIALLHTLIRYPQLKTKKILVICPKSTIMNWADEIQTWLRSVKVKLKVLHFPDPSDINKKLQILREWHAFKSDPEGRAGCMLIGYEAFRSLAFYTEKRKLELSQVELDRIKKLVDEYLLKPGADLVVCDEGHVIKNRKSTTSRAVNKISSRRRIILTGTPIQNNLKEYYSMVNFIKPSFLGTEKEFANLYENPIKEGQHKDSSNGQIRIMKQRSYVLHKKLSKFVQRREAALLKTFLPEKYEYVLFIPMTELQNQLYQHFLDNNPLKEKYGGKSLIPDYTFLRKIWTHPKVLENAWKNAIALRDKRAAARKRAMDSDEEPDDVLDSQVGKMSVENDWWRQFIRPEDLRSLLPSNKLRILFEILKLCEQNREKCLIFSAFVAVLDVVEYFMQQIHNKVPFSDDGQDLGLDNFHGPWERNYDYYRLDGKTSKTIRHAMIQNFNDPTNERVKCFLISAKAGGQGINLVGANRVILLDTSWNPSNDQQNIFRVFRLGQQKKCYIYRLLAMGTMEEKVYSRSVTKQAMSFRVVDEQQIDRHYSLNELAELYTLTIPDPATQPTPVRPVDNILASLLRNFKNLVYKYHEHDSLLENNSAEDLNEQEKADAWDAYEKDVNMKNQFGNMNITADGMYNNPYGGLGMNLNMLNAYNYIPQNLPPQMLQTYLRLNGSMFQTGVEQELLMMSQMYAQMGQPGGSSSYGPLGAMFNSPSSGTATNPYGSTATNGNYFKSNLSPNTTSSPSSYTNIPSNAFNGISPLPASSSSAAVAAQYNLARYLPSSYSALTGASNQASLSTSSRPSSSPSAFPYNLYGATATANSATSAQQQIATNQPGPNAIKNPLLSNLLPPSTSNTKDSFSIPTSVITKASKDVQRVNNASMGNHTSRVSSSPTSIQVSRSGTPNVMNQTNQSHQSSPHSSHGSSSAYNKLMASSKGSSLMAARASPLSSARGSPSISARSSPSVGVNISSTPRSSPSEGRSSAPISRSGIETPNSLSITRTSTATAKQLPMSITLAGSRNSPESNIIVKDVTAINRTVERKPATPASSKTTQPNKNSNMGIVYPDTAEKKRIILAQNEHLVATANNQLQQLSSVRTPQHSAKNRISLPDRTVNRSAINRLGLSNVKSQLSTAKSHSSPNLPTNEVTITPTKRLQRPMTAINTHKLTPSTMITPSTSRKPSNEINKLNSSGVTVSRLPSSTSITRQIQIPSSSANSSKIVGRVVQNPPSKPIPKMVRQGTMPTLKLISQPSNNAQSINKAGAVSRTENTSTAAINRNQVPRVVSVVPTINGVSRTADVRRVFSSPAPKLANFANSSSDSRKRKLEELIPKNTGITLIKKSKPVEIVELE